MYLSIINPLAVGGHWSSKKLKARRRCSSNCSPSTVQVLLYEYQYCFYRCVASNLSYTRLNMVETKLTKDLRCALSSLYSLGGDLPHVISQSQAHDFLIHLQSRNVRRKLQSLRQASKERKSPPNVVAELSSELNGSSWLACLALLCRHDCDPVERLFCAQTLSHRLRRLKVCEAVDWEMDANSLIEASQLSMEQMVQLYIAFVQSIDPALAANISSFVPSVGLDEDQIKGQLSLITLGFITHRLSSLPFTQHTQPLLTTLGASLASLALRLRYTPRSMSQNQAASAVPIVQMILQSLHHGTNPSEVCLCFCLGAIPDTLLGSPGGARGRLSIDPRCLTASHDELRTPGTGIHLVWEVLKGTTDPALLWTCERWAKFLPLPLEFLEPTLKFAEYNMGSHRAAMAYIITIMESGSWTADQILSFSLGISSDQQNHQAARKRQTSKSKKRQKERLQEGSTDDRVQQAEQECQHRGEMSCKALALVWNKLQQLIQHIASSDSSGEGPLGCLCASANTCLPYLVKYGSGISVDMALSLMKYLEQMCAHPDRNVRGLTFEPLSSLHAAVTATKSLSIELETMIVDHLHQCSVRLSFSCAYPATYFHNMSADNDEELEIERNDVRDVLRAICSNGEDTYSAPAKTPWQVLDKILVTCGEAITKQLDGDSLPHETLVHTISALAKPINQLAEAYLRNELPSPEAILTLRNAYHILRLVGEKLVYALPNLPVSETFAVSRLHCLSLSSLSPSFAFVCKKFEITKQVDNGLWAELDPALRFGMQAAALSTIQIPELAAASTLNETQYDIVGAMRSPGGEDHVGILAFMRLSGEGDELARAIMKIGHENGALLMDLCSLHEQLKMIENERQPGAHHGKGVCPKTRRILLETISTLVDVSKRSTGLLPDNGDQAESLLMNLFHSAVAAISGSDLSKMDAILYFQVCEVTFDVAAFAKELIHSISDEVFFRVLAETGVSGYKLLQFTETHDPTIVQVSWTHCVGLDTLKFSLTRVRKTVGTASSGLDDFRSNICKPRHSTICWKISPNLGTDRM